MLYTAGLTPPLARVDPVTEVIHGVIISDPLRRLEDRNSTAARAVPDAKTNSRACHLDHISGRDEVQMEIGRALLRIDSMSSPTARGAGEDESEIHLLDVATRADCYSNPSVPSSGRGSNSSNCAYSAITGSTERHNSCTVLCIAGGSANA